MSDADDQMGGTGGDTGPKPGAGKAQEAQEAQETQENGQTEDDAVTEESKDSFPASDPPANY